MVIYSEVADKVADEAEDHDTPRPNGILYCLQLGVPALNVPRKEKRRRPSQERVKRRNSVGDSSDAPTTFEGRSSANFGSMGRDVSPLGLGLKQVFF
jgi:hypothetical protein